MPPLNIFQQIQKNSVTTGKFWFRLTYAVFETDNVKSENKKKWENIVAHTYNVKRENIVAPPTQWVETKLEKSKKKLLIIFLVLDFSFQLILS